MSKNKRVRAKRQEKTSFTTYSLPIRVVAGLLGLIFLASDSLMNLEFVYETEKAITGLVLATSAVALGAPAVTLFMERSWKKKHLIMTGGLLIMLLAMIAFSLSASIQRSGASRDSLLAQKRTENMAATLARSAYDKARTDRGLVNTLKLKECASGHGPKCASWEKAVIAADHEVDKTRAALQAAGTVVVEDSMAKRISAILPFSETQIQTYQPMLIPLILQLGSLLFIGIAFAPEDKRQEPKLERKEAVIAQETDWLQAMRNAAKDPQQTGIHFDKDGLLKAPYENLKDVFDVKSASTVGTRIKTLVKEGKLETIGTGRNMKYRVLENA